MTYRKQNKKSAAGDIAFLVFYVLVIGSILAFGIWYQWLDISTKPAIRDMAKQQQINTTNKEN